MRKFFSTVAMTMCALLGIFMIFAIGVLAYRNIKLLVEGLINISLILEMFGAIAIFGFLIAVFKIVDDNNYDHRPTPSIEELKKMECVKPKQPSNPFSTSKFDDNTYDTVLEKLRKGEDLESTVLEKLRKGEDLKSEDLQIK